ncbi:MAG: hypothetical protein ACRBN8_34310 [Nannocystales bacterium]
MHRPTSVLDTTVADALPDGDELTVEDEERLARLSARLRTLVNLRKVMDLVPGPPPVSGEFDV